MDGNGRWRVAASAAHCWTSRGRNRRASTVKTAARIHIPALTLYAFSEENWKKRPKVKSTS